MNLSGYETDGVPAPSDYELATEDQRRQPMRCPACGGKHVTTAFVCKSFDDRVYNCRDCLNSFTEDEARLAQRRNALGAETARLRGNVRVFLIRLDTALEDARQEIIDWIDDELAEQIIALREGARIAADAPRCTVYTGLEEPMEKNCHTCAFFERFEARPDELAGQGCAQRNWAGYVGNPDDPSCGGQAWLADMRPGSGGSCPDCGGSGYISDGQDSGEFCGCNAE